MNIAEKKEDGEKSPPLKKRRKKWDVEYWELIPRETDANRRKRLLADLGRLIYSSLQSSQLSQNLSSASLGIESQILDVSRAKDSK